MVKGALRLFAGSFYRLAALSASSAYSNFIRMFAARVFDLAFLGPRKALPRMLRNNL